MYLLPVLPLALCTPPLALVDARAHRLPNGWNATLAVAGILVHAVVAVAERRWPPFLMALVVGVGATICMLLLSALVRGGLGLGDVKLVGALGCVFANCWLVLGCVIVAFVAASLWILPQLGRRYRGGSRIAFGPFLLLGAWGMVLVA